MGTTELSNRQSNILFLSTLKHYREKGKVDNIQEFLQGAVGVEDVMFQFPLTPADMMFKESSNFQSVDLLNYGEYSVSMNAKLATWSISGIFPTPSNAESMPSYIVGNYSDGTTVTNVTKYVPPYDYCRILWDWKKRQTPLVYMFPTWGNYYYCQIKDFNFGRKDGVGNVYYELIFVQYRELDLETNTADKTSDSYINRLCNSYGQSFYVCEAGDNIVSVAKKFFGECKYYEYLMDVNNLKNPELNAGQILKFRKE